MEDPQSKRPVLATTTGDDDSVVRGAANRQATEGTTWFGAATVSSSAYLSMNEVSAAMSSYVSNCCFCGAGILGTPFDPRQLMQLQVQNERMLRGELPPLDDDDDDDAVCMQTAGALAVAPLGDAMQLPVTQRLLTMRLMCCSGRCWMAESLARQGENSVFGKALAKAFPSLTPDKAGPDIYRIYQQKSQALQQQMMQRAMARAQALEQQPTHFIGQAQFVPDSGTYPATVSSSSSFAAAAITDLDDIGDLMDE